MEFLQHTLGVIAGVIAYCLAIAAFFAAIERMIARR